MLSILYRKRLEVSHQVTMVLNRLTVSSVTLGLNAFQNIEELPSKVSQARVKPTVSYVHVNEGLNHEGISIRCRNEAWV